MAVLSLRPTLTIAGTIGPAGIVSYKTTTGYIPAGAYDANAFSTQYTAIGGEAGKLVSDLAARSFPRPLTVDRDSSAVPLVPGYSRVVRAIEKTHELMAGQTDSEAIKGDPDPRWETFVKSYQALGNTGLTLVEVLTVGKSTFEIGALNIEDRQKKDPNVSDIMLNGPFRMDHTRLWDSSTAMLADHEDVMSVDDGKLFIKNKEGFRAAMYQLAANSALNQNPEVRDVARWIVWEGSQQLGCASSSIHDLYMARGRGEWDGSTIPAINVRTMTYEMACTIFERLKKYNAKGAIFEIAKSEIGYTDQRPAEYSATILAAAIATGWEAPVFLQGDHFQVKKKDYDTDPKAAIEDAKTLIKEAIEGGFYNIDLDTSTLVVLDRATPVEEQRDNAEVAAELTKFIREVEPKGITVSVGGEIGEIGRGNSTPIELRAYMEVFNEALPDGMAGLSKMSIQTGTSHGGVVGPDGELVDVKIDFKVLEALGIIARDEFGMGGVVQHGASTLPETAFGLFADRDTLEVHLATAFQNTILDHGAFPPALREAIYAYIGEHCLDMWNKDKMSKAQFRYKARKKALGPMQHEIWAIPMWRKGMIMSSLDKQLQMIFDGLKVEDNGAHVDAHIKPVAIYKPYPVSGKQVEEAVIEDDNDPLAD